MPSIGITIPKSSCGHYGSVWVLVPFLAKPLRARHSAEHCFRAASSVTEDARGHQLIRVRAQAHESPQLRPSLPGPPSWKARGEMFQLEDPQGHARIRHSTDGGTGVCWAQDRPDSRGAGSRVRRPGPQASGGRRRYSLEADLQETQFPSFIRWDEATPHHERGSP